MKKLSPKRRQKLIRLQRKRWRKHRKHRGATDVRQATKAFHELGILPYSPAVVVRGKGGRIIFTPPQTFSFSQNFCDVSRFIWSLRTDLARIQWRSPKGTNFLIDIAAIQELGTTAALALASELDRWQRINGRKLRVENIDDWNPVVSRQLADLGFFSLLETENISSDLLRTSTHDADDGMAFLTFVSGTRIVGEKIEKLSTQLADMVKSPVDRENRFYDGVIEAMANVGHHAYPSGVVSGITVSKGRWWLMGSHSPRSGRVKASFLDHGIGIPASLPRSRLWEQAQGYLIRWGALDTDDARRIEAAMEASRTATESEERGHGLNDIRNFVEEAETGSLRIRSGRGEVAYRVGAGYERKNHDIPVAGTVIEWEIYL